MVYIIINRAVLPGSQELCHKQENDEKKSRKHQRQMSTSSINVYIIYKRNSETHTNKIYRISISIHNRIKCCIHIYIIDITDKHEKEKRKAKLPYIIRNLRQYKLTSNSGDLNGG